MSKPLPFRLRRAAAILARSEDRDAADARAACVEVAARMVQLEEALRRLLHNEPDGEACANRVLLELAGLPPAK